MTKRSVFKTLTPFSQTELALLYEHYPRLGPRGMVALLPGRSAHSISNKAQKLDIKVIKRVYTKTKPSANEWTPAELSVLLEHFPAGGVAACAPLLPRRSEGGINRRARGMGLDTRVKSPTVEFEDVPIVQRHIPAGAWRIDHHVPPVSVFGLGGV